MRTRWPLRHHRPLRGHTWGTTEYPHKRQCHAPVGENCAILPTTEAGPLPDGGKAVGTIAHKSGLFTEVLSLCLLEVSCVSESGMAGLAQPQA